MKEAKTLKEIKKIINTYRQYEKEYKDDWYNSHEVIKDIENIIYKKGENNEKLYNGLILGRILQIILN